ncbi:hypothetical protein L7F22_055608 [Adiantum nelumboides]|nr:hypothetical protein [Adiantum nelumboides]
MGFTAEAGLACPGHIEVVTPIIEKLRLHIHSYVDDEEFYIKPLDGCDALLGIPWLFRVQGILDAYNKKITVQSRGKTLILDVKLKGESIPTVSTSAITYLPPERLKDHAIDLVPGDSPPNRPPYRVSAAQQKEIMSQVGELLEKGLIQPNSSPFCPPVLLVQKKDGSWHMCIEYRALNKNTIKNRFPIPRIDDILDKLEGAAMFSRIDLKSGYHQIRIRSEDVHKIAFRTAFGLYKFLVMPFGLTNAPATFNRMMDRIFRPHQQFVGTFFDDMIVYSKNEEEHRHHLAIVFKELRSHRFLINAKKSEFFLEEIHFLGHIVSKDGVRMDLAKDLIRRFHLHAELDGHVGCVNTVHFNTSGDILVTGSDDRQIALWDWGTKSKRVSFYSGHEDNVFQARIMPFSDNRTVISCSADGQVA